MTTTILNLDEVKPAVTRVLKLKGKEHPQVPTSVGDFIENTRAAKALVGDPDPTAEFELILGMVGRSFPSISQEELRGLTNEQLSAILAWSKDDGVGKETAAKAGA